MFRTLVVASLLATMVATPLRMQAATRTSVPSVVENGSDVVTFPYPGVVPLAFTPDGSAYAELPQGIVKIAADGTTTLLPGNDRMEVDRFGQNIVYSNGYLWYVVYHGIVRIRPDGSQHRYFQFSRARDGLHYPTNLTAGADGLYFNFYTQIYAPPTSIYHIARLDVKGKLTVFSLPPESSSQYNALPMVWADGHLYFEYERQTQASIGSLGRLESNGTMTILPGSSHCLGGSPLVFAHNAIYFIGAAYDASIHNNLGEALCRATLRGNFTTLTPPTELSLSAYLGLDAQGKLWSVNFFGSGLYSYDIATANVAGPYEPSILSNLYSYVYVGPDQNVWTFMVRPLGKVFVAIYVRHVLSFEPTVLDVSLAMPSSKFITVESLLRGPWSAKSLDPAIATVSPAVSQSGRFTVTETSPGTTSIAVTDMYGNVSSEPVIAH